MSSTARSFIALCLRSPYWSSSILSSKLSTSTVVAMKFTRNSKLSMDLSAEAASLDTKDDILIMDMAFSFRDSAIILTFLSLLSGAVSDR